MCSLIAIHRRSRLAKSYARKQTIVINLPLRVVISSRFNLVASCARSLRDSLPDERRVFFTTLLLMDGKYNGGRSL